MDNGYIDEELKIMKKRSSDAKTMLDADTFTLPISELHKHLQNLKKLDITSTVGDAIKLMQEKRIGAVIITQDDRLKGIITERDILMKVVGHIENYKNEPIENVMTKNPSYLLLTDTIAFLMNKMWMDGYRHVPIVNEEMEPLHVVSLRDVLAFILDHFPEEIINLPPHPVRRETPREGA